MKTYINRFPVHGPWGGGALFVKAFHVYAEELGVEVQQPQQMQGAPDVILIAGLDNDGKGISAEEAILYKMMMEGQCDIKLVLRVNECDARKGTMGVDKTLVKLSEHVDGTVFVSRWMQDYFNALGWQCKQQCVVYNGADRDIFKPAPKLENGKVNILAHHWSDNPMKGSDVYEEIDRWIGTDEGKDFTFTYVGRTKSQFKNTTVVKPLYGKALGAELGKHDIYVSASRFDPGPNHVLEALSCGLPTFVHEDGGGCVEFAGADHAYSDWNALKEVLLDKTKRSLTNSFGVPVWQDCVKEYIAFMEQVCKK